MSALQRLLISILACFVPAGPGSLTAQMDVQSRPAEVQTFGTLRAMYHDGRIGSQVRLRELLPNPDLYAVGALADLAGEITIVGGAVHLSFPEGEGGIRTEVSTETDAEAALLVAVEVISWINVTTNESIAFDDIGRKIAELATAAGFDPDSRIPFLMAGEFDDLQWHVIDGQRLTGGGTSHKDHLTASVRANRERVEATLIGFFSAADQGIFTHRGSTIHIHCVLPPGSLSSGHVDHVIVPAGTKISFPAAATGP